MSRLWDVCIEETLAPSLLGFPSKLPALLSFKRLFVVDEEVILAVLWCDLPLRPLQ